MSISIHALREEGDIGSLPPGSRFTYFYPRPPRGGRPAHTAAGTASHNFYPRPPRGGRQYRRGASRRGKRISIHALREEGDLVRLIHIVFQIDFYPRPPRGGRPGGFRSDHPSRGFLSTPSARRATRETRKPINHTQFLSTPSARRATANLGEQAILKKISIHALREEGDGRTGILEGLHADFYPRPPRGGRQQKQRQNLYFQTNYTTFCTNLEEP